MHKLILAASVLALSACGVKEEPPKRPPTAEEQRAEHLANAEKNRKLQDLLEQQRATALSNVETNARSYFAANPRFDSSWKIVGHTDDYIGPARTLTSTLTGPRQPLTDERLAWFTLKYPFITLKVIGLIHWHALRLWLKNIPWFPKAARAADQRGLYRPHGRPTASAGTAATLKPGFAPSSPEA